jgi:Domain of unknown function (DUF4383)
MEAPSPARLYATVVGALLVVLGLVGFFYSASFGGTGSVEAALGALRVNGWLNLLYLVVGGIGVLVAGASSRPYALAAGWLFTVLAIWGWANGGDLILGFIPASGGNEALHLALGLLGLGAAAATPSEKPRRRSRGPKRTKDVRKEQRNSKSRAEAARQRA